MLAEQVSWCCRSMLPMYRSVEFSGESLKAIGKTPSFQPAVCQFPCACPQQHWRIMTYLTLSNLFQVFLLARSGALWEFGKDSYWSHLCILGECIDIGGWCWIDWRYFVKVFINVNSNSFSFTNSTLVNNHRNMEGGKVLFAHDLRTEVGTRVCSSWTLSLGNESVRQLERMRKFSGCLIP